MIDYLLADDLSGALDVAAAFHRAGRAVRVVLSGDPWSHASPGEVLAITTETRNAPPAEAAAKVDQILRAGTARRARLCYKKIDSTLRGPVAAEIEALQQASPGVRILFAPANPRAGRTVQGGVLRVNGVPVAETPFGRDPLSPLRTSNVREILGDAADSLTIPDVTAASDLERAVAQISSQGDDWLAVGSGALATPVAARRYSGLPPTRPANHIAVGVSPTLLIGGSAHPLNRQQAAHLATANGVAVHTLALERPEVATHAAAASLQQKGSAVLLGPDVRIAPESALRLIVNAATELIADAGVRRVFATGGETAYALCRRLEIQTLDFLAEIEPGLSLSLGVGHTGAILLAVKPGGFGDATTWVKAWSRLRAER